MMVVHDGLSFRNMRSSLTRCFEEFQCLGPDARIHTAYVIALGRHYVDLHEQCRRHATISGQLACNQDGNGPREQADGEAKAGGLGQDPARQRPRQTKGGGGEGNGE
jgi:hypothetical protein